MTNSSKITYRIELKTNETSVLKLAEMAAYSNGGDLHFSLSEMETAWKIDKWRLPHTLSNFKMTRLDNFLSIDKEINGEHKNCLAITSVEVFELADEE